ncbi:hypothetical protein DFP72DRAFT_1050791 [Ephemerocybe angulata]|uniref:Uncharacterized protein n=1 Tax=Ephemerocybe angulata TaxID=980116 RepID=A0A8H6LZ44_9AGAR|nr:hypothetical protein DFP72DRAFT_1050791 [Tulosesus angulatus]
MHKPERRRISAAAPRANESPQIDTHPTRSKARVQGEPTAVAWKMLRGALGCGGIIWSEPLDVQATSGESDRREGTDGRKDIRDRRETGWAPTRKAERGAVAGRAGNVESSSDD